MKNILFSFLAVLLLFVACSPQKEKPSGDLKLWYNTEAKVWEEALPLGNGRIGAMVFGNPLDELYQLNEETLWSGEPVDGNNPKAQSILPLIRKAINEGDYKKAELLWKNNAQGPYSARYLPLADLRLKMLSEGNVTNFYRDLNISNAVTPVTFEVSGVKYTRTSFISYPDQVMVVRIEADKEQAVSLDLMLNSQLRYETTASGNSLILKGKAPKYVAHRNYEEQQVIYAENEDGEGLSFEVKLQAINQGGKSLAMDSVIRIEKADALTLILSTATSFNGFDKSPGKGGKDPAPIVQEYLDKAIQKPYEELLNAHIKDYQNLFSRVKLDLGSSPEKEKLPTNERLVQYEKDSTDNGLVTLYYQFGRYLSISSSRQGGIPANLQGIWNRHIQPPWGSNYTTNINTEMNYWLAETTNLQECHYPLLDFIGSLASNGKKTAEINYGLKGWTAHHNSDVWAMTHSAGGYDKDKTYLPEVTCWPMSGAWFSQHLWEHYAFGGDKEFLKEKAYPVMKSAAEFMLGWLHPDNETEYLITSPSTSPENRFKYTDSSGKEQIAGLDKASTMDMSLIWDLFTNCIQASKILDIDADFRQSLTDAKDKLFPLQIGSKGQLQEWHKDFEEAEPTHRHVSHLYGLHPGKQISPRATPELASACKRTLELRGDGGTGWAMAWKINLWARLEDGNHAYTMLKNGLTYVDPYTKGSGGGTYPNLFDAHPPFQIDGNFGGTAGITEMLMQSHNGEIFILPALPDLWPNGSIKGLRARGGFTIDIEWKNGEVINLKVHSRLGGNCRIRMHHEMESKGIELKDAQGNNTNPLQFTPDRTSTKVKDATENTLNLKNTVLTDFDTQAGMSYEFYKKN